MIDETHKISTLFGWVNVPSAAWIDEEGRIVRTNEGTYAGEHEISTGLFSIEFGSTAFADATRDWVLNGAESRFVQKGGELAEAMKPFDESEQLADAAFKLGLHFKKSGNDSKAEKYFSQAQSLCPDNWNFHRQAWTHEGEFFALRQWFKKTKGLRTEGGQYYEPMGLPGEPDKRVTTVDFFWTKMGNALRSLFGGKS